jgi:hypothetical protein
MNRSRRGPCPEKGKCARSPTMRRFKHPPEGMRACAIKALLSVQVLWTGAARFTL